jgi:hypothetical protein
VTTTSTTEICIFCHTPHHTNETAKPLWNRGTDNGPYTAYGNTVAGNTTGAGPASLACLSCHDGTTQFDVLVNAPGAGGIVAGGSDRGWTFTMGTMTFGNVGNDYMATLGMSGMHSRLNIGGGGGNAYGAASGLSDDHPVGVEYFGSDAASVDRRASLRAKTDTISTIDLTAGLDASDAAVITALGTNIWAVSGFITDTAVISDLLRSDKVECSSCHDPHFSNHSWDEYDGTVNASDDEWNDGDDSESDGLFLRRVGGNTGSGVCRTCHAK